jgi:hypothetical protein
MVCANNLIWGDGVSIPYSKQLQNKELQETIQETVRSRKEAEALGFAGFNRGPHLCVEIPKDETHFTISVKTPMGKRITFAFMNWNSERDGHVECVDIRHDSPDGLQKVAVMGQGPTFYVSKDDAVSLVVMDLKE